MIGLYIALGVGVLLVALIVVVLIRTITFKPRPTTYSPREEVEFDKDKAVADLAKMIQIKTVSSRNKIEEDEEEFVRFEKLLFSLFPNIVNNATFVKVGERGLLFKIAGKNSLKPTVFMAHYDVVAVAESEWTKPPFSAEIEDGIIWGRGTLDTKITLNAVMQSAEKLLGEGFEFENDIYLAFAGDEEIAGTGASQIVEFFEKQGIAPALVVDEGGAVVEGVFPGVKQPCALIGIAEKGMMDLSFEVHGAGGHASSPPPITSIGKLSRAVVKMEENPFPFTISEPASKMFDTLGRHSSFALRMVFANLWLFKPVLNILTKKKGGELNALMRTTCAFTQMQGSKGANVLPPNAKMCANFRLISGETVDGAIQRVKKTVNNSEIDIKLIQGQNPSRVSVTEGEGWDKLTSAIANTWQGALVSPYLMVACSDSRHYGRISDKVYRFSAMALSSYERSLIHANDERVPFDTVYKAVEFYIRLMKNC